MSKKLIVILLFSINAFAQTTVELTPTQDNSMFSEYTSNSNGAGVNIFAGRTLRGTLRRGLIKFDVSSIPSNAQITSVSLTLATLRSAQNGNSQHSFSLHKLLKTWGQGTSNALGTGATATANDATWQYNLFNSSQWTTAGGDFVATASATASARKDEFCVWSGAGLISDVSAWVSSPSTNHGWIIIGQENVNGSAKGFASREYIADLRPVLSITYTIPPSDKILINEVNPNQKWIELYNPSTQVVILNNYYVVNNAYTSALVGGSVNVLNGNLSLNPNEYIVLGWNDIGTTTGEIALYNNNPTGSGIIMDYVQYGATNQSRATAAVTAQVWNSATAFLTGVNLTTNTYSLDPSVSYPQGGKSSNATHWLVRKQTPTYQNVICPNTLNLTGNIINAQYNSTGDFISTGSLNSTSNTSFISQKAIILNPSFRIDSGGVFEAKIEVCN